MRKFILTIFLISSLGLLKAQTYNDGCVTINMAVTDSWVEEFEDPFFADESAFRWYGADNANLDGAGWLGGSCLLLDGYNFVFWRTIDDGGDDEAGPHPVYSIFNNVYGASGPNATNVPQFLQLRGTYVGEDCIGGSNCNYDSGFFTCAGDNDDYGYDDVLTTTLNYRFAPPNQFNYTTHFTGNHGGSDFGAEVRTTWTSPRPTVSASTSEICSGQTTAVTLTFNGAVFGGEYMVYDAGSLVHTTTSSTWTVNLNTPVTYDVYTRNNGTIGNCYSSITISTVNCNFNCETEAYNTATTIIACAAMVNIGDTANSFNIYGIPTGSYVADVEVEVEFSTLDADELHLMFYSENGGSTESTSLVDGIDQTPGSGCYFSGSETNTNVIWDEDAATVVGNAFNVSDNQRVRSTCDNPNGVEFDKWEIWDVTDANTDWYISAGSDDQGCDENLTIHSYSVTVCGCKPPVTNSAFVSDGVNTSNSSITICESQGGNIILSTTGSTSSYDTDGYGPELRWFSGSCGGTYLGSGNNFPVAAPTSPGTYQYYAEYYVDGERCSGAAACDRVDVIVDAATVAGTVQTTIGGATSEIICTGATPSQLTVAGNVGTIQIWEMSTDAVNWTTVQTGGSTYNPSVFLSPNTYFYRATVQNNTCDIEVTTNFELTIQSLAIGGTATTANASICHNELGVLNVAGTNGNIQWQESSSIGGPFTDIAFGGSTDNYYFFTNNTTGAPITVYYRAKVSNAPCSDDFSNTLTVVISPEITPGTTAPDQMLCYNEIPADITLSGSVGGNVVRWEFDDVPTFASPTTIANVTNTLTGPEIVLANGGTLTQTLYVRAIIDNAGCNEETSSVTILRINDPDPIVGQDASGVCNVNTFGYVHLFDPVTEDIIASITSGGQNLGDVSVDIHYHGGNAFTIPALGPNSSCDQPQAVLNRSFVINSTIAPTGPVTLRLYFTDSELNDLISLAGCGDTDGCADNDDVCSINDLYVTQITGAASEDGNFDQNDGTFILHTPTNNGTGNATFGANYVEFTVTQFSEFWIHGSESGVPLPVEMLYFNATTIENEYIQLDWSTATEINNAGFDIERSIDGVNFDVIGWMEGSGTTSNISAYEYNDFEVTKGTYYYRLRQVDFNGDYEYTSIVSASIVASENNQVGWFVPNPADNQTSISIDLATQDEVYIEIYNNIGQKVINKRLNASVGTNKVYFDTNQLPGGTYSAMIKIGETITNRKLMVVK